jgi:glycosyltransferase involved in cell wall biosynthesis
LGKEVLVGMGRRGGLAGVGDGVAGGRRVVCSLFFFPRGGSAQVARALSVGLAAVGWRTTLVSGSLGAFGASTNAATFFSGIDVRPVEYTPVRAGADPLAASVPFPPSYEDRPGAPDRVFAAVSDDAYERLVLAWSEALAGAGAGAADLLHLHHLTPANEAALRSFPNVPIVGQLHGTELAMLRAIEAGAPPGWDHAAAWAVRVRRWARACRRLIVPPGSEREVGSLLGISPGRLAGIPSGVDLRLFRPRPLAPTERISFWRRWLVEEPQGWDESGQPGTVCYRPGELWPFEQAETIFLFVGRFTAVKRLPLLLAAHKQAQQRFRSPAPLVLVGGHPGEWEGHHPQALIREIGNDQAFLAGWHDHEQLPQAMNAADLLVLPSVAEAFGLVLVEAMASGLAVIAVDTHGPAEIVAPDTGWLIPPDDQTALTDALALSANDRDERERRRAHASPHARRHYSWQRIARQVAQVYAQTIADNAHAPHPTQRRSQRKTSRTDP